MCSLRQQRPSTPVRAWRNGRHAGSSRRIDTGVIEDDDRTVWDVALTTSSANRRNHPTRSTRACGIRPGSTPSTVCSRWHPGCGRHAATTCRTSRFIAGDDGWIVIDPLTSEACAGPASTSPTPNSVQRPVTAVIYTHSHIDHFGGVHGIVSDDDVRTRRRADHRTRRLPARGGVRERDRRAGDESTGALPVRAAAACRARASTSTAASARVSHSGERPDRADRYITETGEETDGRRHPNHLPAHARGRSAGRDELLLP